MVCAIFVVSVTAAATMKKFTVFRICFFLVKSVEQPLLGQFLLLTSPFQCRGGTALTPSLLVFTKERAEQLDHASNVLNQVLTHLQFQIQVEIPCVFIFLLTISEV